MEGERELIGLVCRQEEEQPSHLDQIDEAGARRHFGDKYNRSAKLVVKWSANGLFVDRTISRQVTCREKPCREIVRCRESCIIEFLKYITSLMCIISKHYFRIYFCEIMLILNF